MHKGMTLAEMAREIHENAKAHGWWDEERETAEVYALIHSEWSEALEEYRAGRPDRWYFCEAEDKIGMCHAGADCVLLPNIACKHREAKPEGVCVELIDGVIRILDYIAYRGEADEYSKNSADGYFDGLSEGVPGWVNGVRECSVPGLVNSLHYMTCASDAVEAEHLDSRVDLLVQLVTVVWQWIKGRGLDPEELLIEKHEYNVTRPYKHGKVC